MDKDCYAKEPLCSYRAYPQITQESHPAVKYVQAFLEAQVKKDYTAFANCFGQGDMHFFLILPGGNVVRNQELLLARHRELYASPKFQVELKSPLQDGVGNNDFFSCSVLVHVTLPNGCERTNYLDMTFFNNCYEGPKWVPVRLVNTVVDSSR